MSGNYRTITAGPEFTAEEVEYHALADPCEECELAGEDLQVLEVCNEPGRSYAVVRCPACDHTVERDLPPYGDY